MAAPNLGNLVDGKKLRLSSHSSFILQEARMSGATSLAHRSCRTAKATITDVVNYLTSLMPHSGRSFQSSLTDLLVRPAVSSQGSAFTERGARPVRYLRSGIQNLECMSLHCPQSKASGAAGAGRASRCSNLKPDQAGKYFSQRDRLERHMILSFGSFA